jgi:hypothetical protein
MHTDFWLESQKKKRHPERPRHRWGKNIKINVTEIGWGSVDWIHMAQDRD